MRFRKMIAAVPHLFFSLVRASAKEYEKKKKTRRRLLLILVLVLLILQNVDYLKKTRLLKYDDEVTGDEYVLIVAHTSSYPERVKAISHAVSAQRQESMGTVL